MDPNVHPPLPHAVEILSTGPLRAGSMLWRSPAGAWTLTVACKATFRLEPDVARIEGAADDVSHDERPWDGDPARSLHTPNELVPFKVGAEVVLVGHAFSAGGQPVRALMVRLAAGALDKRCEVWCDRVLWQGRLLEGQPFARMPLRYERAAGGPGTSNPVGLRFDAPPDAHGSVPVPNLQPPGSRVARPGDTFAPIGFGPIAATWPDRIQKLRQHAASWPRRAWVEQPFPSDVDPTFFNCAPPDQRLDALRADEPLLLENLHPTHARLTTRLPGLYPQAVKFGGNGVGEEIAMVADTLHIDTDRGTASLVWRGHVVLRHPAEAARIVLSMRDGAGVGPVSGAVGTPAERLSAPPPSAAVAAFEGNLDEDAGTVIAPRDAGRARALPFDPEAGADAATESGGLRRKTTLPFVQAQSPWAQPASIPTSFVDMPDPEDTGTLPGPMRPGPQTLPFDRAAAPPSPLAPPHSPVEPAPLFALGAPPLGYSGAPTAAPVPPPEPAEPPAPPPEPPMVGPLARAEIAATPEPSPPNGGPDAPGAASPGSDLPLAEYPVDRCGAIAASIARRRADTASILKENGLRPAAWAALERHWADAIRAEAALGRRALLDAFDGAYVARLEEERGPIEVEGYARLLLAAERGTLQEQLAAMTLPPGAMMRIERVWVGKICADPDLDGDVEKRMSALREPPRGNEHE